MANCCWLLERNDRRYAGEMCQFVGAVRATRGCVDSIGDLVHFCAAVALNARVGFEKGL